MILCQIKKQIIDVEEWDTLIMELTKCRDPLYDDHDCGFMTAIDRFNEWMNEQPMGRTFIISEEEDQKISEWKQSHRLKHACPYGSCIGGEYSYVFSPTSIGTMGSVVCDRCGEEFVFRDL